MLAFALCFGLFGAIIGSFLNVLILRRGARTILGRSGCLSCGHELEAVDLVPLLSWIALRGRCRFCGSRISIQYPLVEGATAILFGFIGAWAALPLFSGSLQAILLVALYLAIAALFVAISAYDLKHTIIPDGWVYALALLALLSQLVALSPGGPPIVYELLAGPLCALPFAALWFVSRGRWMGLGDAKLALGVGWLLGPVYGILAVMFAFVLGAAVSVFILLPLSSPGFRELFARFTPTALWGSARLGFTMKSEVAFGPFLAAACVVIWILLLNGHDPLIYLPGGSL